MAWSWSHTNEAYQNAADNLWDLPDSVVATIWAEWEAAEAREYGEHDFNPRKYRREIRRAYSLIRRGHIEGMKQKIWGLSSDHATCDNGGWNAWLCPWGCGCHTVPFDRERKKGCE